MSDILINIGGHGIGDCCLSLQISYLLTRQGVLHKNLISARPEVFNPLNHVAGKVFDLENVDESVANHNAVEHDLKVLNYIKNKYNSNSVTFNVPDLLFLNPLSFKYSQYGLTPQIIKKTRVFADNPLIKEKIIYCGLSSNGVDHIYKNIPLLLNSLAEKLPDYTIYFPFIKKWVKQIEYQSDFSVSFLKNVVIDEVLSFNDSLDLLKKSSYGIFSCNGLSHLAYHLGIPRLILDPKFQNILWISRWKEDYEECIPIQTAAKNVASLVYHNLTCPQTTMVDRKIILQFVESGYNKWNEILYFKF